MPACHAHVLHESSLVAVHDSTCFEPRSGPRVEQHADGNRLQFTRAGMFVTHQGAGARRTVVADPGHVLLFNDGAPYRVSHPTDHGDLTTVLDFPADVARDAAARHDRAAWADDAPPFPLSHVLAAPHVLLDVHRLRRALRAGDATSLAAEETALTILDAVMRDAARARDARPVAQRAGTRRARRELVETVKARIAVAPGADLTLPALAREVASSPFHLARTFRDVTGVPIHQYQLRVRLGVALDRLGDTSGSLGALAHDLGFSSHAHFTATFRRTFGVAPSAVRDTGRHSRREAVDAA